MANVLQDRLNEMVENIISKIENNQTDSWFKSWVGSGIPTNFATKSSYNGFNILSLMFESERNEYKSNYWLTFNQIKELKATVKKGEKSTPIFFFKPLKIKEENENGEVIEKTIPLLKSYNVFNLDQTSIELGNEDLKSWLSAIKAEPKLLWKSASEAQKILDYFISLNKSEEIAA